MRELLMVAGSFLLLGGFVGWVIGRASGFVDGAEAEKQKAAEREIRERARAEKKVAPQI